MGLYTTKNTKMASFFFNAPNSVYHFGDKIQAVALGVPPIGF